MNESDELDVVVLGAGTLGCWLGAQLSRTHRTTLLGRPRYLSPVSYHGITHGRPKGAISWVPTDGRVLAASLDPKVVADADLVVVAVKNHDTLPAIETVRRHLRPQVPVITVQAGVEGVDALRATLGPDWPVDQVVVPATIVYEAPATFLQTSGGAMVVPSRPATAPFVRALRRAGLGVRQVADTRPYALGQLLWKLNSPINALSGISLHQQMRRRDYREVLAVAYDEGLAVLQGAGEKVAPINGVSLTGASRLLRTPDAVAHLLLRAYADIDRDARSAMAVDLARGARTEVTSLTGHIVELGRRHDVPTPLNTTLLALVKTAEKEAPDRLPRWTAADLLKAAGL